MFAMMYAHVHPPRIITTAHAPYSVRFVGMMSP
jgi:hypothetical protein